MGLRRRPCSGAVGVFVMPWINQDMCAGCGICVDLCPAGAIEQKQSGKGVIDDDKCIRCGRCHTVCPREAIRHDSERIPELVEQNIAKTTTLLTYYDEPDERQGLIERLVRHFGMQIRVAEVTIEKLKAMEDSRG